MVNAILRINMDYKLTTKTVYIDTNPYGFYMFAADYFRAGEHVYKLDCDNRINYSAYFLFTRSIELGLKSILLASKIINVTELKIKCSHDFDKIFKLFTSDLRKLIDLTKEDEKNIMTLNHWYKTSEKKFEYYSLSTSGLSFIKSSYPELPELKKIRDLNVKFFSPEIKNYILSNS